VPASPKLCQPLYTKKAKRQCPSPLAFTFAQAKPETVSPKQNTAYSISAYKLKVPKNINELYFVLRFYLINFLIVCISEAIKNLN